MPSPQKLFWNWRRAIWILQGLHKWADPRPHEQIHEAEKTSWKEKIAHQLIQSFKVVKESRGADNAVIKSIWNREEGKKETRNPPILRVTKRNEGKGVKLEKEERGRKTYGKETSWGRGEKKEKRGDE